MHFFTKITLFFILYRQHSYMSLNIKNDVSKEKTNAANQQETNSTVNQHLKRLQKNVKSAERIFVRHHDNSDEIS